MPSQCGCWHAGDVRSGQQWGGGSSIPNPSGSSQGTGLASWLPVPEAELGEAPAAVLLPAVLTSVHSVLHHFT